MSERRIWIGMSGGVDSSLAAALLAEQGNDCLGVTMVLGRGAADAAAVADSRAVCVHLGIEHRVIDLAETFQRSVIDVTVDAYAKGLTPNPCVICNSAVKFGSLLAAAREAGASLASGHYARIVTTAYGQALARARDVAKDQTYFLYRLSPTELADVIFPLGGFIKSEVRTMAAARGLSDKHSQESQDACFVGPQGYAELVAEAHPTACVSGPIVDRAGVVLGQHLGICRYTVGQRRGIGVASPEALYVLRIDAPSNTIVVGPIDALRVTEVHVADSVWFAQEHAVCADVMLRYNSDPVPADVLVEGERLVVRLREPASAVAPGQALVCYNEDVVIGGGVIEEAS